MKKNKKEIIILITVIAVLAGCFGAYIVYDKVLKDKGGTTTTTSGTSEILTTTSTSEITTSTTTTTQSTTKIVSSNYIHENTVNYSLNNVNHKITYKYYYKETQDEEKRKEGYIFAEVYLNNKKIDGANNTIFYFGELEKKGSKEAKEALKKEKISFRGENIPVLLGTKNLKTLKGADKDYFVLSIYHIHAFNPYVGGGINPQIINDNGKLLYTARIHENSSLFYTDETKSKPYKNAYNDYNQFYVNSDKLYYMTQNCFATDDDGMPYEYILTVANDKVTRTEFQIPKEEYIGAGEKC